MTNLALSRNIAVREQIMGRKVRRFDVATLWRNWKARRQITKLQDCGDATLNDIGVTRDELSWASRLPLTVNAALALEDRAYRRRKEERHMWL
jgi:uncharacterized protein YjiS (DUF1127 family)